MTISVRHHEDEWGIRVYAGGYHGIPIRRDGDNFIAHIEKSCDTSGLVDAFIADVQEQAKGLTNATIHISGGEDSRGDEWADVEVHGDRPATAQEIGAFLIAERENAEYDAERVLKQVERERLDRERLDRHALERAKAAFPEQFKEETR